MKEELDNLEYQQNIKNDYINEIKEDQKLFNNFVIFLFSIFVIVVLFLLIFYY